MYMEKLKIDFSLAPLGAGIDVNRLRNILGEDLLKKIKGKSPDQILELLEHEDVFCEKESAIAELLQESISKETEKHTWKEFRPLLEDEFNSVFDRADFLFTAVPAKLLGRLCQKYPNANREKIEKIRLTDRFFLKTNKLLREILLKDTLDLAKTEIYGAVSLEKDWYEYLKNSYEEKFFSAIEPFFKKAQESWDRKQRSIEKTTPVVSTIKEKVTDVVSRVSQKKDILDGRSNKEIEFTKTLLSYYAGIFSGINSRTKNRILKFLFNENSEHSFDDIHNYLEKEYGKAVVLTDELKSLMSYAKQELHLSTKKEKTVLENNDKNLSIAFKKGEEKKSGKSETVIDPKKKELQKYLDNPEKITFDVLKKYLEKKGFKCDFWSEKVGRQFKKLNTDQLKRLIEYLVYDKWEYIPARKILKGYDLKVLKFGVVGVQAFRLVVNNDSKDVENIIHHDEYMRIYFPNKY